RLLGQIFMNELCGQRVQVDDAIDTVGRFLQGDEFLQRTEIVAEMEVAGRLDAGKDERLERGGCCHGFHVPGLWRAVSRAAKFEWAYGSGRVRDQGAGSLPSPSEAAAPPRRATLRLIMPKSAPPVAKASTKYKTMPPPQRSVSAVALTSSGDPEAR